RISTARNHHFLISIYFWIPNKVIHPKIFINFKIINQGLSWLKASQTSSNGNNSRLMSCSFIGGNNKTAVFLPFYSFCTFAQSKSRFKLFALLQKVFGQISS